jgi:hypothetical protein
MRAPERDHPIAEPGAASLNHAPCRRSPSLFRETLRLTSRFPAALALVSAFVACCFSLVSLSPVPFPFASAAPTCPDTAITNDGGGTMRGIDISKTDGYIWEGPTSSGGGLAFSYRSQTGTTPYASFGRSFTPATTPNYAPIGASFLGNVAVDDVNYPNKILYVSDPGAAIPNVHVVPSAAPTTAYGVNAYAGITLVKPTGIYKDKTRNRLYIMDDAATTRLMQVSFPIPAAFDYNVGTTLGWGTGNCHGVCADEENGFIYVPCHGTSPSKIFKITMMNTAGTATTSTIISLANYALGRCRVLREASRPLERNREQERACLLIFFFSLSIAVPPLVQLNALSIPSRRGCT